MSTDEVKAVGLTSISTGSNKHRSVRRSMKWLSPDYRANLIESSFHARDVALVILGAEAGFITSTLGFLSAILGGLAPLIFLTILVALNACVAGHLIYKIMHMDDDLKREGSTTDATTSNTAEN